MYFVYELVDPRNNVTGYIGIMNNPNQRYQAHIEGREEKGKKCEWIRRLQEEGIQPKMKTLEIVDNLA
jgi:predicted GIY-YIG superfamily endonuclease